MGGVTAGQTAYNYLNSIDLAPSSIQPIHQYRIPSSISHTIINHTQPTQCSHPSPVHSNSSLELRSSPSPRVRRVSSYPPSPLVHLVPGLLAGLFPTCLSRAPMGTLCKGGGTPVLLVRRSCTRMKQEVSVLGYVSLSLHPSNWLIIRLMMSLIPMLHSTRTPTPNQQPRVSSRRSVFCSLM
jgi:hypothetical protein